MKTKFHYGWVICIGCFILNFCALGMCTSTISVFYPYLRETLGISNTEISMIPTIRSLASTLIILVTGAYYRKLGLRKGSAISCVALAISWLLFANARTVWMCYAASAVMGVTYSLGALYPIAIFMRNWFEDRRATAMAVSLCGSSLCAIVLPPLMTGFIEKHGLVFTYHFAATFCLICAAVLFLTLREQPSDIKMEPYRNARGKIKEETKKMQREVHLSRAEQIFLTGALLIMGLVAAPSTAHYSIHFQTVGYTSIAAATGISVYGIALAVGKGLFGIAEDRYGAYKVNIIFLTAWVLASASTALVNGSMGMLYMASFLNGLGLTNASIAVTLWCGELASKADYEKSVQRGQIANTVGSLVGTPIPGLIADFTGSYTPIYLCYAVALIAMAVIVQTLYKKHIIRPAALNA